MFFFLNWPTIKGYLDRVGANALSDGLHIDEGEAKEATIVFKEELASFLLKAWRFIFVQDQSHEAT